MHVTVSSKSQRTLLILGLAAALSSITPTVMATPVLSAAGSYNLGTDSAVGATASPTMSCSGSGTDALVFTGSGQNNIGIHSYSCNFGSFGFGSRSSGENTYFVNGQASVDGDVELGAGETNFSFYIDSGQVGAFGSTAFGATEYQESQLAIKLTINGTDFLDETFDARVGENGMTTYAKTGTTNHVGYGLTDGNGYVSYSIFGGYYSFDLSSLGVNSGVYDVNYVMTSMARGNVAGTTACRAPNYYSGGGEEGPQLQRLAVVANDDSYASFCGAGAQSGDPFPSLARASAVPEPGSLTLLGLAGVMLAFTGAKRRRRNKA